MNDQRTTLENLSIERMNREKRTSIVCNVVCMRGEDRVDHTFDQVHVRFPRKNPTLERSGNSMCPIEYLLFISVRRVLVNDESVRISFPRSF